MAGFSTGQSALYEFDGVPVNTKGVPKLNKPTPVEELLPFYDVDFTPR
jgi:hypothetical protein